MSICPATTPPAHHEVGEALHMAAGLEHNLGGHGGALQLRTAHAGCGRPSSAPAVFLHTLPQAFPLHSATTTHTHSHTHSTSHTHTHIHCHYPHTPHRTHLQHILLQDEVVAPRLRHVLLHGAAGRAVVVEARHRAVDLEGGDEEEAALQGVELRVGWGGATEEAKCETERSDAGSPLTSTIAACFMRRGARGPLIPAPAPHTPWRSGRPPCWRTPSCQWHPPTPACHNQDSAHLCGWVHPMLNLLRGAAADYTLCRLTPVTPCAHLLLALQVDLHLLQHLNCLIHRALQQMGRNKERPCVFELPPAACRLRCWKLPASLGGFALVLILRC